jgi:hypothetical protein
MSILIVAWETDVHPLLLGEFPERGGSMGIMALKAEPLADFGVLALIILSYNLVMALCTVNHAQLLLMGNILDIGVTIDTIQITVDCSTKFLIIYIEGKLPLSHRLFRGGRNDNIEPLFRAHLEDIAASMAFETCLILYSKRQLRPETGGTKNQQ